MTGNALTLCRGAILCLGMAGYWGMAAEQDYAGLAVIIAAALTWWVEPKPAPIQRDRRKVAG